MRSLCVNEGLHAVLMGLALTTSIGLSIFLLLVATKSLRYKSRWKIAQGCLRHRWRWVIHGGCLGSQIDVKHGGIDRRVTRKQYQIEHRANNDEYPWEIDYRKIKFKEKIAKGNFGEVWVGQWLGSNVAIKTVIGSRVNDAEFIRRFILEIKLMSILHHPNIVMFLGACIRPLKRMCLVLEYCQYGNLHEFLGLEHVDGNELTLHNVLKFAIDIARGVHYIHQKKNIIQRDLKSRNVLIDIHLNAKVADFGLSRLKEEDDNGMTACGTPAWTAPEVIRMENYDEKVDVYSFGIVMWELISRKEPYDGQGGVQVAYAAAEQGLRPEIPSYCPRGFADLMVKCWDEKPQHRPGFGTILETLFTMIKATPNATFSELKSQINQLPRKRSTIAIFKSKSRGAQEGMQ